MSKSKCQLVDALRAAGRVGIAHHLNTQMSLHDLMIYGLHGFEYPRWRADPKTVLTAAKIVRVRVLVNVIGFWTLAAV